MPSSSLYMCIHSPPDILSGAHMLNHLEGNIQPTMNTARFSRGQNIVKNLATLYKEFDRGPPEDLGNDIKDFWKWKSIREDIVSESVFALLLGKEGYGKRYSFDEMTYLCQREGGSCSDEYYWANNR